MKIRNHLLALALVALGVSALAIPFVLPSVQFPGTASARPQDPGVTPYPGGRPVNIPPQTGGPMPPQGPPMMMGGGGTAMALDGGYLYIVQGGQLFKVRKSDLHIEAQGHLHMPMNEGMPTL